MFVLTDCGKKDLKPEKVFEYKTHIFAICEVPVKSLEERTLRRCVHLSTGMLLPFNFCKEKTIKSYIETSLLKLEALEERFGSASFCAELEKYEVINVKLSKQWKIQKV